jgi:DNA primase
MLEVAELRRQLDNPLTVCAALGLAKGAKRQPRGLTVLCPVHKEKSPSCSVTVRDDGTISFHCFACGAGGDVLALIAAVRGLDAKTQFPQLLGEAAALAGLEFQDDPSIRNAGSGVVSRDATPERIDPQSYNAIAQVLLDACAFVDEPDVLKYCDERILILEGARAQLAALPPPPAQSVLIAKLLDTFSADSLELAGLLWRDEGTGEIRRDRFAFPHNRLVIPWRNVDGSVAVLQRRRLDDQKAQKYVFPTGIKPLLPFGAEALRASDADRVIVLVEGGLDVLALRLLDRRDRLGVLPLGLPGLAGWRPDWARFAKGRTVRIGFDADAAAEKSIQAVAEDLGAAGAATVERWTPNAKDWCALVEQQAGARKERAQ